MSEEVKEASDSAKRLTPEEWDEIRNLLEYGKAKISELAQRFGVTPQAIHQYCARHKIQVGSKKHLLEKKVSTEVAKAEADKVNKHNLERRARIDETKKEHYEANKFIARNIISILAKTSTSAPPVGSPRFAEEFGNIKALRAAAAALAQIRQERYAILDVDGDVDEQSLPKLIIRDLSKEEIDLLKNMSEDDEDEFDLPEVKVPLEENDVVEEE